MRPIRLLTIYLSSVFLAAALLAPWLYKTAQWNASQTSIFQSLADQPFHRYVNRCLIGLALVGLWPFLKAVGFQSHQTIGFAPLKLNWKKTVIGFCVGFVPLAIIAVGGIFFQVRILDVDQTFLAIAGTLLAAMLTAVVVSMLEETLFRGAVFGTLRKTSSFMTAMIISSSFYALLHFFAKAEEPAVVAWNSGFFTLAGMLRGFADLKMLLPGFLNLFLIGSILALGFEKTGDLYFSIGLHASWIFWLKSYGALTNRVAGAHTGVWGGAKIIDGWMAGIILCLTFVTILYLLNQKRSQCSPVK